MMLPERQYYTFEELLNERWKQIWPDMTIGLIENLIDSGKINSSWHVLEDFPDNSEDPNLDEPTLQLLRNLKHYESLENYERQYKYYDERPYHDPHSKSNCIKLEEVKRYESECGVSIDTDGKVTIKTKKNDKNIDNPKSISSLLKLVATMAISGYGYNSKGAKNPVPADIVKDAEKLGIEISEKTVREWLKKAMATIDQNILESN